MKKFFSNYSYGIIKMFVNQFAISIFGAVLSMATDAAGNKAFTIAVSGFSILFYLFLIYTMTWEIGAKDRIHVDMGKKEYTPHAGFLMSLVANTPNLIIALLFTLASPWMATATWAGNLAAGASVATVFIQGMYLGCLTTVQIAGVALNKLWFSYFLIVVPALVTSWVAYYLGHKEFRLLSVISQKKNANNKKN